MIQYTYPLYTVKLYEEDNKEDYIELYLPHKFPTTIKEDQRVQNVLKIIKHCFLCWTNSDLYSLADICPCNRDVVITSQESICTQNHYSHKFYFRKLQQ